MRRKFALTTIAVLAGLLLALVLLPWWLGTALDVVGRRYGLTFGEYRRIGYARFVLENVEVRRPGVQINVSRVELGTPLAWLIGRQGEVTVAEWTVTTTPKAGPTADRPRGWQPFRAQLDPVIEMLERVLPSTTAGAGEISWPGGKLKIVRADWREHRLHVNGLAWRDHVADVAITHEGERLRVDARATDGQAEVLLESQGPQLTARGRWWGQPLSAQATFAETGWLPVDANIEAVDWSLPAARLGMDEFYDAVAGSAKITWQEGKFSVDVQAEGKPLASGEAPPLQVQLQGSGGIDQLSVNRFDVQMPGVTGHLNEPVVIGRDGRLLSGASRLELSVDLTKQPWFIGQGQVIGSIQVAPQREGVPLVSATLSTANAVVADWALTKAVVDAQLQWPLLSVKTATVKLSDGDELTLGGEWNVRTRTLAQGRVQGRVSRATLARWLATAKGDFENLAVDVAASGTWPQITHEGRAKALGLRVPPVRPLALDLEWKGTGRTLDSVIVDAVAGGSRLQARGAVAEDSVRIDEVVLAQAGAERLRLSAPVRVQWKPSLAVGELQLKGPDVDVAGKLTWGETGEVKLDVKGFESAWLNELVALRGPAWSVTSLSVHGAWDKGPLTFTANGAGVVAVEGGRKAELVFSARGNPQGVQLEAVRASMDKKLVARATGTLPMAIHPGQTPLLRIDETAPLSLDAATEPNAFFWEQLAALTGLVITDPAVRVTMTGTVKKPVGEATVRIAKVVSDGKGRLRRLPEIDDLDARLTADRAGVALETFTLKVGGQSVQVSGRLPVKQWAGLVEDPLSLVEAEGEARIEIPNADVAALSRYAPAYLAPTGTLKVDVSLKPGGQLQGGIWLKDAATRPLGPLGILQSVGAEIFLNGRTVELKQVSASSGGQLVTLSGTVALPEGKTPRLDLALRGEKLPFVRQAGLLVRGDLDLRIVTGDDEVTRITGATKLSDSLFLMDVRAFLPTGGPRNAPGRRPPYFSVDVPPFDEWPLDVTVDGDRFLRLRTPVFSGVASAHFRLGGTLGDPRAIGEAVVDQGQVILPFATFAVRQANVRLAEANPFEPRISLIGTSRRYGYDLRMEVTGTVEKPILTFSSTPPLESEQVLLMVMAGETPQNEVTYSGRQRAARLGAYLGRSLLGQLGPDATATERLSITSGERVSRQGRETYGAEYVLNPRWSLVGEYDEFDEYNLGVKWRVLSEKKPEEEKKDAPK